MVQESRTDTTATTTTLRTAFVGRKPVESASPAFHVTAFMPLF